MKEKYKILRKTIRIGYLVLLGCMFLIAGLIRVTKEDSHVDKHGSEINMIRDGWTLDEAGTRKADMRKLGSYVDEETGQFTLYYKLPELEQATGMIFRTKDVSTKILVDGVTKYETVVPESRFYNRSPGNLWNFAYFGPEDSGKTIAVQISVAYDANAVTFDSVYWGTPAVIIMNIIREKIGDIVVSLLMMVLGSFMVIFGLITQNNLRNGDYSSCFLGIFAIIIGIWSLLETNVLQFLVMDMRIIQTIDNMAMIVGFMPLIIYLDYKYHVLDYLVTRMLCILDFVYVVVCVVCQLTGIKDFHELLLLSQLFILLGSLIVLGWVIIEWRQQWKEKHRIESSLMFRIIGISVLLILTMFAVVQYTREDVADRAQWIRVGMLIFVICFGGCNLMETYNLIAQGLKFDIMEKLAYMDGLTGLGNRTSYFKQIDAYASEEVPNFGVVFMDINNLKIVNDRYGHEEGDAFIRRAAGIIKESFGKVCNVYRTGGDEFCALIAGPDPGRTYQDALEVFQNLIEESNRNDTFAVKFQIAQGFACCENATKEKIEDTVNQADEAMYADKKRLKDQK